MTCEPNQPAIELTKREYFASKFMQGMLAGEGDDSYRPDICASRALRFADALIDALNKERGQ